MYSIQNLFLFNLLILFLSLFFYKIKNFDTFKILFFSLIISIYFGFRPLTVGADTYTYFISYINLYANFEFGFNFLNQIIFSVIGPNYNVYFSIINFIMISNLLFAFKLIIKKPIFIFSAWIIVSLPYSILMQINIIRQGLAISFFILGIALIFKKNIRVGFFLLLLSITIHFSMVIYIFIFLLSYYFNVKKGLRIPLLIFIMFISYSGLPVFILNYIRFNYLSVRFFSDTSIENFFFLFAKIFFYFFIFIITDFFMSKDRTFLVEKLSLIFYLILLFSIVMIHNELYSTRFLLFLDFLLPAFVLTKGSKLHNKSFLFLCFFAVYAVFIFSLFSIAFQLNFNY